MDIKSFEHLVRTENTAKRFLTNLCWKNYRRFRIRCNSYHVYRIVGKRFRCKRCKYTFHDFTGRWINKVRIRSKDWLWLIKLFELELSARKISQQIDLSYLPNWN
jgi:transposase